MLASLFHLRNKETVACLIQQTHIKLMKDFTPYHLDLKHIDRQTVLDHHQTALAMDLFTVRLDQICIVMDSNYLYILKSSNNEMQRRTYSIHKHRKIL